MSQIGSTNGHRHKSAVPMLSAKKIAGLGASRGCDADAMTQDRSRRDHSWWLLEADYINEIPTNFVRIHMRRTQLVIGCS